MKNLMHVLDMCKDCIHIVPPKFLRKRLKVVDNTCAAILRAPYDNSADPKILRLIHGIISRCIDRLRNCPSPSCPEEHVEEYREVCSFIANYLGICGDVLVYVLLICLGKCVALEQIEANSRERTMR